MTPEYEDAGLFRSGVVQIAVELTPLMHRNGRRDIIVEGFVAPEKRVEVVFAGRRSVMAAPIITNLMSLRDRAVQRQSSAAMIDQMRKVRFPLQIEGAWRRRFESDANGWDLRIYQLIASRWTVIHKNDQIAIFGEQSAAMQAD